MTYLYMTNVWNTKTNWITPASTIATVSETTNAQLSDVLCLEALNNFSDDDDDDYN